MELPGKTIARKNGLINLLRQRETLESGARIVPQKAHVTENLIARLGLEGELEGHTGCVNCLEWNESGTILASSSDDMKLCLWDPFRKEIKMQHPTGHDGNVFSVKFMPKSNDKIVVTGAGDNCVIVHEISVPGTLLHCCCHAGRVKRIATENVPNLFWTASEDGTVMEYDLRTKHYCKPSRRDHFRVLVDLVSHAGRKAEAKCLAVNPMKPEMIAVGANDPYVRLYDRRMIKLGRIPQPSGSDDWARISPETAGKGDPDNNVPLGCAQYFIPGHLRAAKFRNNIRSFTTTYLTFSADGNELLVNMGGEQIYLFDVDKEQSSRSFQCSSEVPRIHLGYSGYSPERLLTERIFGHRYFSIDADSQDMNEEKMKKSAYGFDFDSCDLSSMNVSELPMDVEKLKQEANSKFQEQQYACAISIYNKALLLCPKAAVLYANRAATFMKRKWDGDIYAALRDCQTTLLLDPEHVKAHFRLAKCLHDLARYVEANKVLEDFKTKFPEYSMNSSHRALRRDINEILETIEDDDMHASKNAYLSQISGHEAEWRINTIDYKLRFCGHCNTTTDIKEANFFGNNGQYIVAGSDDGSFFIWDRYTTNIVRVLRGDDRIVNCLQPHPSTCLLATSGIDPVIRIWGPLPEDGKANERNVPNPYEAAMANQDRMNSDPFELMMMSMGYRFPSNNTDSGDDQEDSRMMYPDSCRTS